MKAFDYNTRREITNRRKAELEQRIRKLSGNDKELALELLERTDQKDSKAVL